MIYRLQQYPIQVGPLSLLIDGQAHVDRVAASTPMTRAKTTAVEADRTRA